MAQRQRRGRSKDVSRNAPTHAARLHGRRESTRGRELSLLLPIAEALFLYLLGPLSGPPVPSA